LPNSVVSRRAKIKASDRCCRSDIRMYPLWLNRVIRTDVFTHIKWQMIDTVILIYVVGHLHPVVFK
jgi:hypothetical protein